MNKTNIEYTNVMNVCRDIFAKKSVDYGTSWRILRPSSLTDQIFIKAQRIRTLQETGENKVGESFEDAFTAIVNYCIMAVIQVRMGAGQTEGFPCRRWHAGELAQVSGGQARFLRTARFIRFSGAFAGVGG